MTHVMKRRVTVLASMISVLLVTSVAFAAWTANGAGNGYAEAGSHTALTTTAVAVADKLFPTTSSDVKVTINNGNPYDVAVSAINGSGTITSSIPACNTAGHGVTFADQDAGWTVPANDSLTVTLADAASMANTSDNTCQNADFTIPVTILGTSAE